MRLSALVVAFVALMWVGANANAQSETSGTPRVTDKSIKDPSSGPVVKGRASVRGYKPASAKNASAIGRDRVTGESSWSEPHPDDDDEREWRVHFPSRGRRANTTL